MSEKTYPAPQTRLLIAASALAAVVLVTLDTTIATIAVSRIQSSLSASAEQITWVLTSYLIAAAVMTPLAGWLADRFGRIRVMEVSVAVFTLTSLGCGLAPNLEALVVLRFIQGAAGAGLIPLSQVLMLDIYPPEKQGPAAAAFGLGTMIGPLLGPTLGAWLIDFVSWRWIFLVNVPIGLLSLAGFAVFATEHRSTHVAKFDLKGFLLVSATLAAMQLMLDRGQLLDWFSSVEISVEAALMILFGYLAVVHVFTTEDPFINPVIFKDRNFTLGTLISALLGVLLIGVMPLITTMMQQLLGYPVMVAGLVSLPRALGNGLMVAVVGALIARIDPRIPIFVGMLLFISSFWILTGLNLDFSPGMMAGISLVQGLGSGLLFLPMILMVFTTLPERYKNQGATMFSLVRNVGAAVGISVLQTITLRDIAANQSRLVEHVRADNPIVSMRLPDFDMTQPASVAAELAQVSRQATVSAYGHTFSIMLLFSLALIPLCFAMRPKQKEAGTVMPAGLLVE